MKLVKQIGFGIIALSLCGLFGCGKRQPTAFERLRQSGAYPSAPVTGSSQELVQLKQMWWHTYHARLHQILDEMDRLLRTGAMRTDPTTWARILGGIPDDDVDQRFSNSNNPTIKIFMSDFATAQRHASRFENDINSGRVDGARSERDGYATTINKIDALLR